MRDASPSQAGWQDAYPSVPRTDHWTDGIIRVLRERKAIEEHQAVRASTPEAHTTHLHRLALIGKALANVAQLRDREVRG